MTAMRGTSGAIDAGTVHISSAVVSVRPEARDAVAARLAALPGTEVHAAEGGKIVIVMEGPSSDALGARLASIALMEGVLAAGMVYEVVDDGGPGGSEGGDP
jgi:nitrate reductase NapD